MATPNRAKSGIVEFPCKKLDVHVHLGMGPNPMNIFNAEERIKFDRFFGVDKCVLLPMAGKSKDMPSAPGMMSPEDACAICEKYPLYK